MRELTAFTVIASLMACLCLSGCGDSSDGGGGAPGGVSYQLHTVEGDVIPGPLWTIAPGTRFGNLMVRDYRFKGVLEVGDLHYGMYPRARMLMPANPHEYMEFSTNPWGVEDDRVVKMGKNSHGDSQAHNREDVVLTRSEEDMTFLGTRRWWSRASNLDEESGATWMEGIGPVFNGETKDDPRSMETVILTDPRPRVETGPTVQLTPALEDTLVSSSFRPQGLDVVAQPDGSLEVHLSGAGMLNKIMSSEMGSPMESYHMPAPGCTRSTMTAITSSS